MLQGNQQRWNFRWRQDGHTRRVNISSKPERCLRVAIADLAEEDREALAFDDARANVLDARPSVMLPPETGGAGGEVRRTGGRGEEEWAVSGERVERERTVGVRRARRVG